MPPIEIQTSKPISTAQRSPIASQPPSQQSSRAPSPTFFLLIRRPSRSTLSPPPFTGSSAATSRYAPANTSGSPSPTTTYPPAWPGASIGPAPTGAAIPPPPRSPTRTTNPAYQPSEDTPSPPQPGPIPTPGRNTAQSLLAVQPGAPPPPQPSPAPSLSHPPGYHQNAYAPAPMGATGAVANTSMGTGSLTPLSISRNPSPVSAVRSQSHHRNMSGAGLPDPGSGGVLNGVLPEGAAEQAGQAWTTLKGWVGSTASVVGKKAVEVEGQVWRRVNGE